MTITHEKTSGIGWKQIVVGWTAVHLVFCMQLLMALPNDLAFSPLTLSIFRLHYLIMFFYPGSYPLSEGSINYPHLLGELLFAAPASFLYTVGFLLVYSIVKVSIGKQ